jgi:Asp-tRNA(Asn)/Glu-tRNA(Gln) amidotransferase A subunit family amidase
MIPFIKTTTPPFTLSLETNSNLWGRTLNPWNKEKAAGGSSGGESSIISSRCSFIGVGTDAAGSIRVPSHFCGIFGLRSYSKRIPFTYQAELSKPFYSYGKITSQSTGPLGRSSKDLALFMDVATN